MTSFDAWMKVLNSAPKPTLDDVGEAEYDVGECEYCGEKYDTHYHENEPRKPSLRDAYLAGLRAAAKMACQHCLAGWGKNSEGKHFDEWNGPFKCDAHLIHREISSIQAGA